MENPLELFHRPVRQWFRATFAAPTPPQTLGWPAIARGASTLILAPTGSGKTLAAFLWCLDRLMFTPPPPAPERCRVLYVSPLKALASDVERNLRIPLAGIAQTAAALGEPCVAPAVAIRTGDTPAADRVRFQRHPADILITTPESLYLLLTSSARRALRSIETVIVDEIHALVPTKRGAHLALSLERLEAMCTRALQRIGLSATQRPLDEVARFLGGATTDVSESPVADAGSFHRPLPAGSRSQTTSAGETIVSRELASEFTDTASVRHRPVTIVDAGTRKRLQLRIEVPVEDMTRLAGSSIQPPSIWSAIHPRLLELIRTHRSTLIFVNSRRLAERLAGALNDLAGETLVRSHHGSIARIQRLEIEERLKAGTLRALAATSSLELGIDMGIVDLVIQIEAPPSVASGLQRIGRAGHRADAVSEGVIVPKFRGDLMACAAVSRAMHDGAVESTRYPRNPLDVLAQQIVAAASVEAWTADTLFALARRAAPFAALSRPMFEGVLDMLSGRYPSDEFAELRPRITWDRAAGTITAREGARRVAISNGGTIPDRGLYGVFLLDGAVRVGELDEEMVFESRVGDVFVLGASSWRIAGITHDRVLVSPAPGEPGKMPFWKGDRPGRPFELGLAIGQLMRDLLRVPAAAAVERLTGEHDLDRRAAENLLQYLRDQVAAAGTLPDDSSVIVERVRDDLGDWRIAVLSPRGGRVHAPWAMAAAAKIREELGFDVEVLWGDDGFVVRFPDVDQPPDSRLVLPDPDEVQALVVRQLGATALFAAKFRENAARSLLLPKRRPGMRAPLWQQRKRAADLLAVASKYGSFPVLLETYRECLHDFFDMPALVATLRDIRSRRVQVATVDSDKPSPFAASLLFSYVANFLYDGDAPLAERRAQALAVDEAQLRELVGDAELRDLLDADSIEAVERQLQRLAPGYQARSLDGLHDMLLSVGDLSLDELRARATSTDVATGVDRLVETGRALAVHLAGEQRYIAVEDAARFRDALGVLLPPGLPASLLQPVRDPLGDLARRYARTHAPFTATEFAARYALDSAAAEAALLRLTAENRLIEGEFRPQGTRREWTEAGVLRAIRRRSLARLRREVEPVDQAVLARFTARWHSVGARHRGPAALLDVVEQLQGAALPASILESEILGARLDGYDPAHLDEAIAAGDVVWIGVDALGDRDGRVALYLADQLPRFLPPGFGAPVERAGGANGTMEGKEGALLRALRQHGASFFGPLHEAAGGGYPGESVDALWRLVWRGLVTNDTFHALRAYTRGAPPRSRDLHRRGSALRVGRLAPPTAEGRWTLVAAAMSKPQQVAGFHPASAHAATTWAAAVAQQLLSRHGVLTREIALVEGVPGGFGAIYPVLKTLEERGRVRRGYFVAGLGATQFALPGALDLLRSLRDPGASGAPDPDEVEVVRLAATDPANPYGASLKWPAAGANDAGGRGPARTAGATVVLVAGAVSAFLARGDRQLRLFLPDVEPHRSKAGRAVARSLIERAREGGDDPRGMLIEEIDGVPASQHPAVPFFIEAGFAAGPLGLQAVARSLVTTVS